jgi:hypothetical protein
MHLTTQLFYTFLLINMLLMFVGIMCNKEERAFLYFPMGLMILATVFTGSISFVRWIWVS